MVYVVGTYRVEKNEALVDDLQGRRQLLVVSIELLDDLLGLSLGKLDQQTLIRLDVEGCDVHVCRI
jgi:hypothetical protein